MRKLSVYSVPKIPEGKIDNLSHDFRGGNFRDRIGETWGECQDSNSALGHPYIITNALYSNFNNYVSNGTPPSASELYKVGKTLKA